MKYREAFESHSCCPSGVEMRYVLCTEQEIQYVYYNECPRNFVFVFFVCLCVLAGVLV